MLGTSGSHGVAPEVALAPPLSPVLTSNYRSLDSIRPAVAAASIEQQRREEGSADKEGDSVAAGNVQVE